MWRGWACLAIAACGGGGGHAPDAAPTASYDVVVVGAGTGGTSAAIAAAHHGVRVLLVEPSASVGGQMASVPSLEDTVVNAGFHSTLRTGFAEDLRQKLVAHYQVIGLDVGVHGPGSTSAEPQVVRQLLVGMLEQQDVTVRLQTSVTAVTTSGSTVTGVTLSDGTIVSCKIVIDATELGDVLPLAGAEYRAGNQDSTSGIDPAACIQSITYVAPIRKYVSGVPPELVIANPPPGYTSVPAGSYQAAAYGVTERDGFASLVTGVANGVFNTSATDPFPWSWAQHDLYRAVPDSASPPYDGDPNTLTRTSVNLANDYPPIAWSQGSLALQHAGTLPVAYLEDPQARHELDCEAKLATLGFLYYMQHELAVEHGEQWAIANDTGFDNEDACSNIPAELAPIAKLLPPYAYVRESRRMVALHMLTGAEIQRTATHTAQLFHTAVARGWYVMDLHGCNTPGSYEADSGDATTAPGNYGPIEVPFESLIPIAMDGLLAAEKNLGVSRLANGTTRLEAATLLTGEAVGVMAAMAVTRNVQPRALDPYEVQKTLVGLGDGISMDDLADVAPGDPTWPAIQMAVTRGVMLESGPNAFAPGATLSRELAAYSVASVLKLPIDPNPASSDFADVPLGDPYLPYVEALFHAGLTSGCGGGNFCPTTETTRFQLAAFIARGLGGAPPACTTAPFSDVTAGDPMCPAIAYVAANGLMTGCGGGNFCPTSSVTRVDTATVMVATMDRIGPPT